MNFSAERDSAERTTFSFTKWTSRSSSPDARAAITRPLGDGPIVFTNALIDRVIAGRGAIEVTTLDQAGRA